MYYFLYRLKRKPDGGLLPPKKEEGVTLGLAEYCEWFLGIAENPEYILKISDYNAVVIPDDVVKGIMILDEYCECDDCEDNPDLNLDVVVKAKRFIRKLKVRSEVNARIGDIYDTVSDLNKRTEILEHIIVELMSHVIDGNKISDRFLRAYKRKKNNFSFNKYVIDLLNDDQLEKLIDSLDGKSTELTNILEAYYKS